MFDNFNIDRVAFEIPIPEFIQNSNTLGLWGYLIFAGLGLIIGLLLMNQKLRENGHRFGDIFNGSLGSQGFSTYQELVYSVVGFLILAYIVERLVLQPQFSDGLEIFWYGILVTLGIIIGVLWAAREIDKRNQNVDELYNGVIVVVLAGYIFARLTYVVLDIIDRGAGQYNSFAEVINIRAGGVNILGGFIGAALVGILYIRLRGLNAWHYADVAGPALLIAQAIGRWGNFINQELYGPPTSLPWGITIDAPYRLLEYSNLAEFPADTRFHPTFLYESIALLIGFILLLYLNGRYRDQWKPGTLIALFLVWWGGNRAWIEFFRPDQTTIGSSPITYSMVTAVVIALVGVYILLYLYDKIPESARTRRRRKRALKPKVRRN